MCLQRAAVYSGCRFGEGNFVPAEGCESGRRADHIDRNLLLLDWSGEICHRLLQPIISEKQQFRLIIEQY